MITNQPPQDIPAEQAVLCAIMLNPDSLLDIMDIITEDDFYYGANRVIFNAMVALYEEKTGIDIITLQNKLNQLNQLDAAGGASYLTSIAGTIQTSANIIYHAQIVSDKSRLRKLISASDETIKEAYNSDEEVENILANAEKRIYTATSVKNNQEISSMKDITFRVFQKIEKLASSKNNITGVETGYVDLDRMTSGLQKTDFIIIAARPSMGKTAFALNIAENVALRKGKKAVAIFSLEMSDEQLVTRMIASESKVSMETIKSEGLKDEILDKLLIAGDLVAKAPIYIDDTANSIMNLASKARKLKAEYDISLIIIDYLQLMQGRSSKNSDNRQQEISEISRGLKSLARELDIPIIALSQLSRSVESRQVKKPMLSDLRESGSLEQDADLVMFLYRDDYYDKETERPGVTDLIIAKHRNGAVGEVELFFRKEITRFESYVHENNEPSL